MTEYKVRFWTPGAGLYDQVPGVDMKPETWKSWTAAKNRAVFLSSTRGHMVAIYKLVDGRIVERTVYEDDEVRNHIYCGR